MEAFVDEHGLGAMTTLVDDDGSLWARFEVRYQPAWVLLGTDGTRQRIAGPVGRERLGEYLDALR